MNEVIDKVKSQNTSNRKSKMDLEKLFHIVGGHSAFQLLWAGVSLGLFDVLSEQPGLGSQELSRILNLDAQPTRILLMGLTAVNLIQKEAEHYYNDPLTEQKLVKGKPGYLGPMLGWQAHIVYPGQVDFLESLKQNTNVGLRHFPGSGNTLYERLMYHPKLEKIFQDAMSSFSDQANKSLLEHFDFSPYKSLVDAGGGDATNAMLLAKKYPNMRITIFDFPSVCQMANKNIEAENLSNQIFTHPGNFFIDPFPSSMDAIIYNHILTIWSMEKNLTLLKKSYEALPRGGTVIIFNVMASDDGAGPIAPALGSPYFLSIATGEGMLYAWQDYEKVLHAAGFKKIQRYENLPFTHGILVGIK
jgi:ubiquinone/menaquinone biosynthesis C-methylase UbiE